LVLNLTRFPSRARVEPVARRAAQGPSMSVPVIARPLISRAESKLLMSKLSERESQAYYCAARDRRTAMTFDETTALSPEERGQVLVLLTAVASARPTSEKAIEPPTGPSHAKPRRLSILEAARVRSAVQPLAPASDAAELFRQVLWSMEEGALRRFDQRLALNIALKKIREGAWTRPHRLPPNWLAGARRETCNAA
jgi:hypothetical protein